MPRLRENIEEVGFPLGMFPETEPRTIPKGGVRDIENGLFVDEAVIRKRGGTIFLDTASVPSRIGFLWAGALPGWKDEFLLGPAHPVLYADQNDFYSLTDAGAPLSLTGLVPEGGRSRPVEVAALEDMVLIGSDGSEPLAIYAGAQATTPYGGGGGDQISISFLSTQVVGSGTSFLTDVVPGMLLQADPLTPGAHHAVYPVASVESDTLLTLTRPWLAAQTITTDFAFNVFYNAIDDDPYPEGAQHIAAVANRFVFSHPEDEGHIPFSDVGNPQLFTLTDFHRLPGGAKVVGLKGFEDSLLLFTDRGIFKLDGLAFDIVDPQGNPQHRLTRIHEDIILWGDAATGVVEHDRTVIVPALDGVYLIDGVSSSRRISRSIDPTYRQIVREDTTLLAPGQAIVDEGHYLLPLVSPPPVTENQLFACRLDRGMDTPLGTVFPWSRLKGYGAEVIGFVRESHSVFTLGAKLRLLAASASGVTRRLLDCSGYFSPGPSAEEDANGASFTWRITLALVQTGNATVNVVREFLASYTLDDGGVGAAEIEVEVTEDYSTFTSIGILPENTLGTADHHLRVGPPARHHIGARLTCAESVAGASLRRVAYSIRPSQAVRR